MGLIGLERPRVAVAELERGGSLPLRVEAVDALQFVAASGDGQLVEESAASNGLKLPVVTHEGEARVALVGEGDEAGERTGADHSGFVDNHRRTGGQEVVAQRWPVAAFPFVEQLGDGVGAHSGVALECACGFRGRGNTEHTSPLRGEVGYGAAQGARLAGAERPLMSLQEPRVKHHPPSVTRLHLGRDDRVGVDLREETRSGDIHDERNDGPTSTRREQRDLVGRRHAVRAGGETAGSPTLTDRRP